MADYSDENDTLHRYRNVLGTPSRRHVFFTFLWIFFITAFIILAFTVFAQRSSSKIEVKVGSFEFLHESMNLSVNPCRDFYSFSCGLWSPKDSSEINSDRINNFNLLQAKVNKEKEFIFKNVDTDDEHPFIVNNAIAFHKYCMERVSNNRSESDLLVNHLDKMGGFPILDISKWNETAFSVLESSAYLLKNFDVHTIIGMYIMYNPYNSNRTVIYLKKPVYKEKYFSMDDVLTFNMLCSFIKALKNSEPDNYDDVNKLLGTKLKWKKALSYNEKSITRIITIDELSKLIPGFNWLTFFHLATNETLVKLNEVITLNDTVVIDDFYYFIKLADILNSDSFSKEEWANLFSWILLEDIWFLIPEVLENYGKQLQYDDNDILQVIKAECYNLVKELFSCSLDYLYVKNMSHSSIPIGTVLFNNLKTAFQNTINECTWLNDNSKQSILRKLNYMQYINGFPDYLNNITAINIMYESFPSVSKNVLESYISIQKYFFQLRILQLISVTAGEILPRSVTEVGAYYNVERNTLVVPLSIYQPPFLYLDGPWYINFGAAGSVIGHEMMHGLDLRNERDEYGNQRDWLSNYTLSLYENRLECFKDQYSVTDSTGRFKNNGSATLIENIADNIGLLVAYKAFKTYEELIRAKGWELTFDNFTTDQAFFIAFGSVWCSKYAESSGFHDKHSVPELRVNIAVSNLEYFSSSFNCPKGSPMNPEDKCTIW